MVHFRDEGHSCGVFSEDEDEPEVGVDDSSSLTGRTEAMLGFAEA